MDAAFFDAIRPMFGGSLSQSQVDGINVILEAWEKEGDGDDRKLAYLLATAKHETAHTMQPVRETLAKTDAKAKEILTKAWRSGKLPWVKRDYWSGGFFGRGLVQLTHRENYQRAEDELGYPFVKNPSLALDERLAALILIRGCMRGWFTGKKLGDYIGNPPDFIGARRVVNGLDRAKDIANLAVRFAQALAEARKTPSLPSWTPKPDVVSPERSSGASWLSVIIGIVVAWLKGLGRK